jgi:hypothetical protein
MIFLRSLGVFFKFGLLSLSLPYTAPGTFQPAARFCKSLRPNSPSHLRLGIGAKLGSMLRACAKEHEIVDSFQN